MVAPPIMPPIMPRALPPVDAALAERQKRRAASPWPALWNALDQVKDPEIPVLSLWDLGVLRDVSCAAGRVTVTISPTYSGCPAFDAMADDIGTLLRAIGVAHYAVETELSPAWHSGWISDAGRRQLRAYGIAPPGPRCDTCAHAPQPHTAVECPRCRSGDTVCISEFGSTACKALYRCAACHEPFDYFKAL